MLVTLEDSKRGSHSNQKISLQKDPRQKKNKCTEKDWN